MHWFYDLEIILLPTDKICSKLGKRVRTTISSRILSSIDFSIDVMTYKSWILQHHTTLLASCLCYKELATLNEGIFTKCVFP